MESMIAPAVLSALLCVILVYAWSEQRRAPLVASSTMIAAIAGLYLVWFPSHANVLAEVAGVGRGADLILYLWVLISLLVLFNLHLKLRSQMELITQLSREIALLKARSSQAKRPSSDSDPGVVPSLENGL
jgi:small membrane protein